MRSTNRHNLKLRADTIDDPVSSYIHLKLHDDTESDVQIVRDYGNTSLFTDGITDINGTTHSYSGGRLVCDGTQTHAIDTTAMRDFVRLDTLSGVGGLLIMFDLLVTANPASGSNHLIFGGSLGQAAAGGWSITHLSGGICQFQINTDNGGNQNMTTAGVGTGAHHTVAFYYDGVPSGKKVRSYVDGALSATSSDITGTIYPPRTTRVFTLFSRRTADTTWADQINSDSEDLAISDIRIVRFEYDALSIVGDVVADYHKHYRETLLASLAGR